MIVPLSEVADVLREHHYLGPSKRGFAYRDEYGVMVFANPSSRHLPVDWLELARWCITSREPNAGSRQWRACRRALQDHATTVISYSDPSVGHTGALYRACNWLWAPTWLRLRPPPTANGSWQKSKTQAVKDRWVFPLAPDAQRVGVLVAKDVSVLRRMPWAEYREPGGADYKRFKELQR